MRLGFAAVLSAGLLFLAAQSAAAQELFFFPAQGQSDEQKNRDFGECHAWAVEQSGFNPMGASSPPPEEAKKGGVLKGAATGAAGGAVIGAIAGDVGKGAAIGAVGGGLIGGARRHDQKRQQEQAQRNYQQQQAAGRNAYNRAMSACMQGRGYTVG